jgi:hypothetical protein
VIETTHKMACGFHSKPELWRDSGYSRSYPNMEYFFWTGEMPHMLLPFVAKVPGSDGVPESLSGIEPITRASGLEVDIHIISLDSLALGTQY